MSVCRWWCEKKKEKASQKAGEEEVRGQKDTVKNKVGAPYPKKELTPLLFKE
jgi:hypothetical protein